MTPLTEVSDSDSDDMPSQAVIEEVSKKAELAVMEAMEKATDPSSLIANDLYPRGFVAD